ncbi:RHS repeat-associated core domain-containing protein [Paracidovorax avenae]|uniref:RHS repeat-associated core domain-containing protein n=1 Tax=Paracidovorax avenae TaxID=80867 RepID=UPI001CEFACFE|nr:RHS repeat-associated core domain-containing protein [Paracidovorax avenae]
MTQGKPAARQTDLTKKGGPIVQGSHTVLIGSAGGIACSACPGGITEGHPVNPLLGAKVLPGEEDFALPGPLPFALVRSYSSYQSPDPAPVGLLGPGWWLPGEARVAHRPAGDAAPGALHLHDGRGRRIAFEALAPGEIAHSPSEGLWLVRCGMEHLPGAHQDGHAGRLARLWNALPAAVRTDARITVATASPLGPWWVFAPGPVPAAPDGPTTDTGDMGDADGHAALHGVLHGICDRFGRVQRHERHADGPFAGHLRSVTDGAGRRYGFELERVAPASPAAHGWGADSGVRLVTVWLQADPHQGREALPDRPAPLALVRYAYTDRGELVQVTDRTGRTVRRFEYGDAAHPGRMTGHARAGRPMTRYAYDAEGRVAAQTTPHGLDLRFDYTPLLADPMASPPQPARASTLVTDGLGRQRRYVFSGAGGLARVAERIEADGARSTWKHDAAGRLLEHTDALGRRTQHTIDAATGLVIGITDAAGRSHRIAHDALGLPLRHQAPAPEGPMGDPLATTWEHDAWGRLVRHTDPLGHTTHYRYPEPTAAHPDLPTAITDARGGTSTLQWNALGLLACRTDCSGRATRFHYDAWGRTVRVQGEEGLELRTAYDALGRPAESIDALGRTTRWRYAPEGDDLAAIDHPGGLRERFVHDAWGRVVRYEYGSSLTPDPQDGSPGTLATPAPPHWLAQHYRYDLAGRLVELHNENARAHCFTYDVRDRLAAETGFDGLVTRHAYDRGGQRIRTEDARHAIDYEWSGTGQLLARTITPLPGTTQQAPITERFEHDGAGQLVAAHHHTAMHRHQVSVHLRRDRLGRIVGERQEMRAADGAVLWSHESTHALDAGGAPTGADLPGLPPLQWLTYGPGHVHGLLLDGEPLLHIERDGLHRPVALDFGASQTRWRRDALSRLQALSVQGTAEAGVPRPSGGLPGLPALARQHHYDAAGRLARIDTPQGTIHHAYDTAGRLAAAHLPGREPLHYRYDPAGNPWQPAADATGGPRSDWAGEVRRHLHDPAFDLLRQDGAALPGHARDRWPDNRVMAHGPWRYRWDACGNLVEKTHADGRQTHRLHWDHAQRLVAHEQIDHATGERVRRIHHYDVFSRRIASRIERSQGSGPTITERCHGWQGDALTLTELRDPLRPQDAQRIHTLYHPGTFVPLLRIQTGACGEPPTLAQLLGAAEPGDREQHAPLQALQDELLRGASDHTRRHLHSMGWDAERLQRQLRGEGAAITHLHLYHCDHLGTPLALIDAQGRIDWQIELDPWGNTINEHNPLGLHQPIRMQGQHDEGDGAGLFYNRHRYYDPGMGRYVSQDPIGLAGGVNPYTYGNNSPAEQIDPEGLSACYVLFPDYPIEYSPGKTSTWLGGHGGVLTYDAKGVTQYYEYGRYRPNDPLTIGAKLPDMDGNVRKIGVPNLKMDPNGEPTQESMEKLKSVLSQKAGHNTRTELTCNRNADASKVSEYANNVANNKDRDKYNWNPLNPNQCRSFAKKAIEMGQD